MLAQQLDARYHAEARLVAWPADPPTAVGGLVAVVAAGTSDLPVAREAGLTGAHLGRPVELVIDVGVAAGGRRPGDTANGAAIHESG